MSDNARMFSSEAIEAYAAAVRTSYEQHKSLTSAGFQRDLHIATAKLATSAARAFTNRRCDALALRLDAAEKQIRERDIQLDAHRQHLDRLQTKMALVELILKGEKR